MRNIIILTSFLVVMLIVAGCDGGEGTSGPSIGDVFIGGTSGLEISFLENAPPSEVTDKSASGAGFPFQAVVAIENVGEYSVPSNLLNIKLSGFFPSDLLGSEPRNTEQPLGEEFKGVRKDPDGNKIQGDIRQITFPKTGKFEYQSELAGNQGFPFIAEACYFYQTKAISQICLREKLTSGDSKVCEPFGSKPVSNHGAPVHVTSITQSIGGEDKMLLHFTVKKVGTSEIFSQSDCVSTFKSEDRVEVEVKTGLGDSDSQLPDCLGLLKDGSDKGNTGELLLINGEGSFTCVQTLDANSKVNSIKTMDIVLGYYAQDTVSTDVVVKHLI